MDFTAQLDVDVVALEAEDEVTCLVSLTAPVPDGIADRPGETLIAVVDRSGVARGGVEPPTFRFSVCGGAALGWPSLTAFLAHLIALGRG